MARLYRNQSRPGQTAGEDIDVQPGQTTTADAIMLPSRKAAIRRAQEVVQRTSEMRPERVDRLSQALKIGALILDSQILADRLIGIQLHDLQSAA